MTSMHSRATLMGTISTGIVAAALAVGSAEARIVKIEITAKESPTFEGKAFGAAGQYEKLTGRAHGELDPKDPKNAIIVDIQNAPKNARGMVEYDTDITILKPINNANGNHRLWFEVNNRGNTPAYSLMNEADPDFSKAFTAADAGNGFLMRQGYTILEAGWDPGAPATPGVFGIRVPVAKNADGSPITGPSMEEFVIDDDKTMQGRLTYAAANLDKSRATLTVRAHYQDQPTVVPADKWQYTDEKGTAIRLLPMGTAFQQGTLYSFVYEAKDPQVGGIGFAAIRDVGSFFRNASADEAGTANPLAGSIQYVMTACQSQPCRTLHDYLHLGFNQDETGKKVVDGMSNWIGGSTGIFLNYRFGQSGRTHRQHIARWFPETGPYTNQVMLDPVTGKRDGRLARCTASNTCPKIFETNSANEYWAKNMAVGLVDTKGKDLTNEPANVRNYFISSLHHAGAFPQRGKGVCQQVRNPLTPVTVLRALTIAMDEWVTSDKAPPASRVPSASKGTLVTSLPQTVQGFPKLQGVAYNGRMHTGDLYDFGPNFDKGIITQLPPKLVGTPYPALVPKTDADGNDMAGIRIPDVAVPVATYTGWGLRAGSEDGCDAAGQMIPFAKTKAEREMAGDPRPSLAERYPSHADYVTKVSAVANALKADRLMLDEDVQAFTKKAEESAVAK
ncbi:MAG: hypothetical protein EXR00_00025 [Alphaproteobacteria bacterium]|nr:hypothetical protein [Alphaproteobacteria bacterium]